jgi:hypothetical protein
MKTFTIDGKEYVVPNIGVTSEEPIQFRVNEGEFEGVNFTISDMQIDDDIEGLLHYNVSTDADVDMDRFRDVLNDFIILILHEQLMREEDLDSK